MDRGTAFESQPSRAIPSRSIAARPIAIPEKRWHRLLAANRGRELGFEVLERTEEGWRRFDTFHMTVAKEDIDGYLVYRRIHPAHSAWRDMGIYQRDLHSFDESPILTNDYFRGGCVNCHTFRNNRTDTMLVSSAAAIRQFRRDRQGRQGREGGGDIRLCVLAPERQDPGLHQHESGACSSTRPATRSGT